MFGQQIKGYLSQLRLNKEIPSFDQEYLKQLEEIASTTQDDELISESQIYQVLQIFTQRLQNVLDGPFDYTFAKKEINTIWIKLAQQLALETNQTYLQILFPSITNAHDPTLQTPLTECKDLTGFYLADDGKVLHCLQGLYSRIEQNKAASPFNDCKSKDPRALTVRELYRIRSKINGGFFFSHKNQEFNNFWDYLLHTDMPQWQKYGDCPKHLLSELLSLLEDRLNWDENEQLFSKKMQQWLDSLYKCHVDDVYFLYGQEINSEQTTVYLVDALIDLLDFRSKNQLLNIKAVACWLAKFDPSYISAHQDLQSVYRELGVGTSLSAKDLSIKLKTLKCDVETEQKLRLLEKKLVQSKEINSIIGDLQTIYAKRWGKIVNTSLDYTRTQQKDNADWIEIAQLLAGAGYISNYYRFLMPTITHDDDPVLAVSVTEYPLSHYVVSNDEKSLILLDNCAAQFNIHGTFYNCATIPPSPLLPGELERVSHSKRFAKYIPLVQSSSVKNDPPIRLSTLKIIYDLINESCYGIGLIAGHGYDNTQMQAATKAYLNFYKSISQLPRQERENLNQQQILLFGGKKRFSDVIKAISEDHCIALYGKYFAQLIMDYAPWIQFSKEVEKHFSIEEMRKRSQGKVLQDYQSLSEEQALKRIFILINVILTKKFSCLPFSGCTIQMGEFSNYVPGEVKNLFSHLAYFLQSGDLNRSRFTYVQILEAVIKPVLVEKPWFMNWLRQNQETLLWFKSIKDDSLFKKKNIWYEPQKLFLAFWKLSKESHKFAQLLADFLEQLIIIDLQSANKNLHALQINLNLFKYIENFTETEKETILNELEKTNTSSFDSRDYYKSCAEYLTYRIVSKETGESVKSNPHFFSGSLAATHKKKKQLLEQALDLKSDVKIDSLSAVVEALQKRLEGLEPSYRIINVWRMLTGRTLTMTGQLQSDSISRISSDHCTI